MLHIDDVNKRLQDFPEPKEVAEIRENIKNSFRRLEFQEGPHKYYIHEDDGTVDELPSVSGICHQFEPYADWDTIKENYAIKHDMTVEEVTRAWKETNLRGTNQGSRVHEVGESFMYFVQGHPENILDRVKPQYEDGFLVPYAIKEEAVVKYWQDIYDVFYDDGKPVKLYPVMPEAQVYIFKDNPWGIKQRYAGTFDILHAFQARDGKWKLILHDYKSNGSLINSYSRSKKKMMLPPFEEFVDEALSHYTIQLSAYSVALMQLGYEIVDRKLIWLKDDGEYEKIQVPDVTDRLIDVLSKEKEQ